MSVRYQIIDDNMVEIHKVPVYRFTLGDVDDPELYAKLAIDQWLLTNHGKFVANSCIGEITLQKHLDLYYFGWNCFLFANLEKKKLAEYYLRFDKLDS